MPMVSLYAAMECLVPDIDETKIAFLNHLSLKAHVCFKFVSKD